MLMSVPTDRLVVNCVLTLLVAMYAPALRAILSLKVVAVSPRKVSHTLIHYRIHHRKQEHVHMDLLTDSIIVMHE